MFEIRYETKDKKLYFQISDMMIVALIQIVLLIVQIMVGLLR